MIRLSNIENSTQKYNAQRIQRVKREIVLNTTRQAYVESWFLLFGGGGQCTLHYRVEYFSSFILLCPSLPASNE